MASGLGDYGDSSTDRPIIIKKIKDEEKEENDMEELLKTLLEGVTDKKEELIVKLSKSIDFLSKQL